MSRQIKSLIRSYREDRESFNLPSGIYLDPGSRSPQDISRDWRTPMAAPLCEEFIRPTLHDNAYYVYLYAKSLNNYAEAKGWNSPEAKKLAGKMFVADVNAYSSTGDWPFRPLEHPPVYAGAILVLLLTGCPGAIRHVDPD
ncbi:hypothetical protein SPFM7_00071 [Salmonella phage SPFM7]|nr:hypothetical protein SPFM7_00071 [Salmonella phage SPFM7]